MGLMRFRVDPPNRITEEVAQQAYLSGIDRIVWPARVRLSDGQLLLEREVSESGCLQLPWAVRDLGMVTLGTGTLIEQPEPYQLALELARGTISQLRAQLSDWQAAGLQVPRALADQVSEATQHLAWSAVSQETPEVSTQRADEAIRLAVDAGDSLVAAYAEQVLLARRRGGVKLPTFLAGDLGTASLDELTARQFVQTFNAAVVPLGWRDIEAVEGNFRWSVADRQVEWCLAHGLKVLSGPLLRLETRDLPDWLYLWEDDFDSLHDFVSGLVRKAVRRYQGKVSLWQCAARLNTADALSLTEQDKLRLAARVVELVRSLDPATPAAISFDQPWAEYMSRRDVDFPPLHFADALIHAGLDVRAIVLEINLGYYPGGTLPRTGVEMNRQLDCWSLLGLPLVISLVVPSAGHEDRLAQRRDQTLPGDWTAATQQAWIARHLPLILAKPYVHGIVWSQLRDDHAHELAHGGLLDARGQPKPALRTLAGLRQTHLK